MTDARVLVGVQAERPGDSAAESRRHNAACHLHQRHLRAHPVAWLLARLLSLALAFWYTSAAAQVPRSLEAMHAAVSATPDLVKGKALYRRECASCHGRQGHGNEKSMVPALAGQIPGYTIKQLLDIAEGDRSNTRMNHPMASEQLVDPVALASLAGYVATLPVNTRTKTGTGKQLELGQQAYANACSHCHGPEGAGNATLLAPALRGQHYSYLLSQMRQIGVSHRYAKPPIGRLLLETMPIEELSAIADAASRLSTLPNR